VLIADETPSRSRLARASHKLGTVVRKYAPAAALVILAIAIWEAVCRALDVPTYLWPEPSVIVRGFGSDIGVLSSATWITVREVIYGFAIAIAAGLGIGITLHLSPTLRRAIYPILIASQSVPTVVLAPVLVILMGFSIWPKLAIIALFTFFPVVVNTVDGLGSVDPEYIRMMLTLDASRWSIFRRVEFPAALPLIFSGIRIGATYAAIGAVFGEWSGSSGGLGYQMQQAQGQLETPLVFEAVFLVTWIAVILFVLVSVAERLLIPWARAGASSGDSHQ
jgi:putative hydroxymethylpyrimidine transport system permease protein